MNLAGHYIRITPGDSAEIRLTPTVSSASRYHVSGLALWGERRESGPHTGELDFTAKLDQGQLEHSDGNYRVVLLFRDDILEVHEENSLGVHGINVTFEGTYRRAPASRRPLALLRRAISRLLGS